VTLPYAKAGPSMRDTITPASQQYPEDSALDTAVDTRYRTDYKMTPEEFKKAVYPVRSTGLQTAFSTGSSRRDDEAIAAPPRGFVEKTLRRTSPSNPLYRGAFRDPEDMYQR